MERKVQALGRPCERLTMARHTYLGGDFRPVLKRITAENSKCICSEIHSEIESCSEEKQRATQ